MYPVGSAFNLAAQGDNRQVIVRATFNDSVVVGGDYLKAVTFKHKIKSSDELSLGSACAKQLNLEMYLPQSLSSVNLKTAKIFVEVGFLGVTNALNQIDTSLYVSAILGYLYEQRGSDELTFSVVNNELVATSQDSGVSVRLSDGNVIAEPAEGVDVAASTFWLPMGVYYVREFEKRNRADIVSVVAYDGMKLVEEITEDYSPSLLNSHITAEVLIRAIGTKVGVSTVIPNGLPNASEHVPRVGYYSKSWRDMLGYFAGFLGCNACFDRLGNLTVKPYEAVDYNIDRSQQYLSGLTSKAESAYTVNSVYSSTPESDNDLNVEVPPRFHLGYVDTTTTSGEVIDGVTPTGYKLFYSDKFRLLYGAQYEISRESTNGFINMFFYIGTVSGQRLIGENADCLSYTGNYPLNNGSDESTFTVTYNHEALQSRVQTSASGGYREIHAGTSSTYAMDDSYKIKRIRGTDGVIGTKGTMPLEVKNPYIYRDGLLTPIQQYYSGLSFYPCSVKYRGNPALDAGDIIKVAAQDGTLRNVIITSHTIKISGGMNATIECTAKTNV